MLALALALRAQGHAVRLAGPPEKAAWAAQLDCPYVPLGADVTAFIDGMPDARTFFSALAFIRFVRRQIDVQFRVLPAMVQGADLVIGSSLAVALPSVAEALEIPYRYVAFTPQLLPSGSHPFPVFKHQGWPSWFNRITWKIARGIDLLHMDHLINRYRQRLGARPTSDSWQTLLGQRVIVASDPSISAVPRDAKVKSFVQVGYLHLDQPFRHFPALEAFLAGGSAPLYAGFGSMPRSDQIRCMDMLIAAARQVGRRIVITKFWDAPSIYDDSDDVFFISHYPHRDLFPHMAAVIHHGGAGTTATSAVSGVPQLIVPQVLDQYYWGHQVHQAGLGARPIWRSRLTVAGLTTALQVMLNNRPMKRRAVEVAAMIHPADSLRRAVKEVTSFA